MPNIRDIPWGWRGNLTVDARSIEPQVADTVEGAIGSVSRFNISDAATADLDFVNLSSRSIRILDIYCVKIAGAGAAGNTITVKSAANAISAAMDMNVADGAIVRNTTIDDANHNIVAGGTLRISRVKAGGNAACIVVVTHVPL